MKTDYLKSLNVALERLLNASSIKETIKALKIELQRSREPFVWRKVEIKPVRNDFPKNKDLLGYSSSGKTPLPLLIITQIVSNIRW